MRRAIACTCIAATAALLATTPPVGSAELASGGSGAAFVDAPQRYVDEVFPTITTTAAVPFATVVNNAGAQQVLLADVTLPVGDAATERPALIWMGGGGFTGVTRSSMANWTTRSARRGYVALTIDYRVRPGLAIDDVVGHLGAIVDAGHDAQAAVRWLRANAASYGVDPERIAVGGYSAGAVTALWVDHNEEAAEPSGPNQPQRSDVAAATAFAGAFGGTPEAGDSPIAMFHGTADTRVAYAAGVAHCNAQLSVGNICELTSLDATHALPWAEIYDPAFDFLYRHLSCGEPFSDVALPHPFCGDIDWLTTNELANGYSNGTFRPTAAFSRQALLAMLWRMAGAPTGAPDPGFSDVGSTHPFRDAIAWAVDAGIAQGYDDGTFRPTATVSRQAAVAWQWVLVGEPAGAPDPGFDDVQGSNPFREAIWWAADAGITTGYADGGFHPGAPVSRQAGAAQLHRTAPILP